MIKGYEARENRIRTEQKEGAHGILHSAKWARAYQKNRSQGHGRTQQSADSAYKEAMVRANVSKMGNLSVDWDLEDHQGVAPALCRRSCQPSRFPSHGPLVRECQRGDISSISGDFL